jgi:hypothetical protein
MPTFAEMISEAEQRLVHAKAEATLGREDSKASPGDRRLRLAAEMKTEQAAKCGRELHFWEFEAEVEQEFSRIEVKDVVPDPLLVALAPLIDGYPDPYWLAAANLVRRGIATPPRDWRAPSGEPISNATFRSDPSSPALATS